MTALLKEQTPQKAPISVLIKPTEGLFSFDWAELWLYRELLFYFTWRDITVRYKQSILGAAWAIIQPVTNMLIFGFIFGRLANLGSDGIPMPIFQYAALVPWGFFAGGMSKAVQSLTTNSNMLKKIYFPRLILPISSVFSGLADFLMAFSVVFLLMLAYQVPLTWRILTIPLFLLLAMVFAMGISFWLAPLNVMFRDVKMAIPFVTQIWFFLTPVAISSSHYPSILQWVYGINPMAGVVEGFRWAITGADIFPPMPVFLSSIALTLVITITGAIYYQRMEKSFADVV